MRRLSSILVAMTMMFLAGSLAAQGISEPNVNMVAGTGWPGGDPFLQRQNEPSVAVSTRNPLHLLVGANDYRTIDLPGLPDGEETGDAWLGVFKSKNGGQSWWSTLLPGYPQDAGSTSVLRGFQAAADPVVRAGNNGMFYFSGIVLNRGPKPLGGVFVSRFIDNNNTENGDPIAYLGTTMIDRGTSGQFLDKPWVAVAPAAGGTCTVNGQTFPAQNVYLAYTVFVGNDNNIHTKLMFARSSDCGATWDEPIKLSEKYKINQGASIAVDGANVYVVWRRFHGDKDPDSIIIAKSDDRGETFTKGTVVADITPFEQGTSATSIRTSAYPTTAVDGHGRLYIAWSDRRFESHGDGRIALVTSSDGEHWSAPAPIEPSQARGHQFMPAMSISGGKVVIAYYDLREDHTVGVFTKLGNGKFSEARIWAGDTTDNVFLNYLMDSAPSPLPKLTRRHTLDLRAASADNGAMPAFTLGRVSRYTFGSRPSACKVNCLATLVEQLQFNPPNFPMFKLGTVPFLGDYIDIAGYASKSSHVQHVVWTDNRDVRPPQNGNWAKYTPPNSPAKPPTSRVTGETLGPCQPGQTGMRNQNIYTARVTDGLFAGSPGNSKPLGKIQRVFVVFVQNAKSVARTFRLSIVPPAAGVVASFAQFAPPQPSIDVPIAARSTATRSIYVSAADPHASVNVDVTDVTDASATLSTTVVLNPDVSNPDVSNPDVSNPDVSNPDVSNPDVSNPDVSNAEVHNPDVSNPDVSNPDVSNPDVSNPDVSNPDVSNPDVSNPDVTNPDVSNPDVSNPDVSNPDVSNPDVSNASVTDTTWTTHNTGNTTSGYGVKLATNTPVPQGVRTQLIVNRIYQTPTAKVDGGYSGCVLGVDKRRQILANIIDPVFTDFGALDTPNPADATLWLAPGDAARITLRVYDTPTIPPHAKFDAASLVTPVIVAHAVNTIDALNGITKPPTSLAITTNSVNRAIAGQPYSTQFYAVGGVKPYSWRIYQPESGLAIDSTGLATGTINAGTSTISVAVSDAKSSSAGKRFPIRVVAPVVVSTAIPDALTNQQYSTTLAATGGVPPYSWTLTPGTGLSLTTPGVLSGNFESPTTIPFTVQVTDSDSPAQSVSQPMALTVLSPLTISTTFLPDAVTGSVYDGVLNASGGSGTRSWTVSPALPAGLTIDGATGRISGTPTQASQAPYTFTVTDARQSKSILLPLRIYAPLSIVTQSIPNAIVGQLYSTRIQATGGTGTYTYSIKDYPPLSIDNAGNLTGTFTSPNSGFLTVDITDNAVPPQTASHQYNFSAVSPIAITAVTPGTLAAGLGQLGVFAVTGLSNLDGVGINFSDGALTLAGFLFQSPSSPSRIYARLPSGLSLGTVTASVVDGNQRTLASSTFTLAGIPGTPAVQAIYPASLPCSVTPPQATDVVAGGAIGVATFGGDTQYTEVQFVQGNAIAVVGSSCAVSNSSIGLVAVVSVPASLTQGQDVAISVRTTVNGNPSGWSPVITLPVAVVIP